MEIETRFGLGLSIPSVEWADEQTILRVAGNFLCLDNIVSGEQRFLKCPSNGIECLAVNEKKGLIAFAEKGLLPKIFVHRAGDLKQISVLTESPELSYSALAFSRNGKLLVACSDNPDRRITIWDWEQRSIVIEGELPHRASAVSFSPTNHNVLCTTGEGELLIWNIEQLWDRNELVFHSIEEDSNPLCHAWSSQGLFCGCKDGAVLQVDIGESGEMAAATVFARQTYDVGAIVAGDGLLVTGGTGGQMVAHSLCEEGSNEWEVDLGCKVNCLKLGGENLGRMLSVSSSGQIHILEVGGKNVPPSPRLICECHVGAITGCGAIPGKGLVVSCGEDGTLRAWNVGEGSQVTKRAFETSFTCLSASSTMPIVALGSKTGVVRVISTNKLPDLPTVFRMRLHEEPVTSVALNSNGTILATGSGSDRVCFIDTSGPTITFLGIVTASDSVRDLCWVNFAKDNCRLVLSLACGAITSMQAPKGAATKDWKYFPKEVPSQSMKIEFPLLQISPAPGANRACLFGLGADRNIRRYDLPLEASAWTGTKSRIHRSAFKVERHGKALGHIVMNDALTLIATGSTDGSVAVFRPGTKGESKLLAHDMWRGGVGALAFDSTGEHLVSCGTDGSLIIHPLSDSERESHRSSSRVSSPRRANFKPCEECEKPDSTEEPLGTNLSAEAETTTKGDSQGVSEDDETIVKLRTLKQNFDRCVLANSRAPDNERLDQSEFVIDRSLEAELKSEGNKRVGKIKEAAKKEIQTLNVIWQRVKAHCWDQMDVKDAQINSMMCDTIVHNFPLARDQGEDALLEKMKFLRMAELKEKRGTRLRSLGSGFRVQLDAEGKPANEKTEDGEVETDQNDSMDSIDFLLYHDFDLIVPRRKMAQMTFLKKKIYDAQVDFNKDFQQVVNEKIADLDRIEEVNARIRELTQDLHKLGGTTSNDAATFSPDATDLDDPETILTVHDSEVKVDKYISPEEQAKIDAERRAEEERLLAARKNNVFERALHQMMGGALEKRIEVEDEFKLEIPEWMFDDPAMFTEEQMKEFKEFQAKEKAIEEEKSKRRSTLESELRTLRASIEDICQKFDKRLQSLHQHYLDTRSQILLLEMQIVTMAQSIEAFGDVDDEKELALMKSLTSLKERRTHTMQSLQDFRGVLAEQQERVNAMTIEDRQMERTFKREFAEAHDHYPELYRLYKWRGDGSAEDLQAGREESDDFDTEAEVPALEESQCPEGLPPVWWDRLVDQRNFRMDHEIQLKEEQNNLNLMKRQLEVLEAQDRDLEESITQGVAEVGRFKDLRQMTTYNLTFPVFLKQGQVEAQPKGVSSDFGQAALIHRSIVEDLNTVIQGKGGKKVSILTAIKDFKKGIYRLQWENEGWDMKAEDLIERTRELQLLRVNKSVHQVVKQGEAALKSHEGAGFEQLMKFNEQLHNKNVAERRKRIAKLESVIMEKAMQNEKMKVEIHKIDKLHGDHKRVQESLSTTKGPSKRLMRNIVTDKKLADIAKAQQTELRMLQQELETWHMRTYPSFVHTTQQCPDEKLPA